MFSFQLIFRWNCPLYYQICWIEKNTWYTGRIAQQLSLKWVLRRERVLLHAIKKASKKFGRGMIVVRATWPRQIGSRTWEHLSQRGVRGSDSMQQLPKTFTTGNNNLHLWRFLRKQLERHVVVRYRNVFLHPSLRNFWKLIGGAGTTTRPSTFSLPSAWARGDDTGWT